jgi:asparagine synthase (glutamine-hydrolysing)
MCGIAGIYQFRGHQLDERLQPTIDAMTDTLGHRGPDSRGTWIDAEAAVGLAACRTEG